MGRRDGEWVVTAELPCPGKPEQPRQAAADGEQALRLVAEHKPGAILLDLHMPVLDGIAATRRLAAEYPGVDSPSSRAA